MSLKIFFRKQKVRFLTKELWIKFGERLGTGIIHPQFILRRFQREVIEEAKKYLSADRRMHLIDIGCGRMPYRKELEPLVKSYTGVDHPEVSKLYNPDNPPEVLVDAKKLPFKNNSFDIALLIQVLEHVNSPGEVIEEAARVVKPNGILIISVPFFYPLHDMPHDWGRYTSTALQSFIREAGFRLVKIKTQGGFFEFWLQMLNTFLVKRINDMILINFKFHYIFLLILTVAVSIPIILFNNLLIVVVSPILRLFPKYPDYFPLDYLVVARKR